MRSATLFDKFYIMYAGGREMRKGVCLPFLKTNGAHNTMYCNVFLCMIEKSSVPVYLQVMLHVNLQFQKPQNNKT